MDMKGPLSGVKVVDLTRVVAGPYTTMCLRELGAEVIKIEPPGGDTTRTYIGTALYGGERSAFFVAWNRGKKSIVLDLKGSDHDKKVFEALLEDADVLVTNYRPGVLEKFGYSWEYLHDRYPGLVYGAISGFGQTGKLKNWAAFDFVVQAMSGLMNVTGNPGGRPVRVGSSIGDIIPALWMGMSICAALRAKSENGGKGTMIDVAMFDSMVAVLEHSLVRYASTGLTTEAAGHRYFAPIAPFQAYKCKGGHIVICATRKFEQLCECIGAPHLSKDPRYIDRATRGQNWEPMQAELEQFLAHKTSQEWTEILQKNGVAAGPVNTVKDLLENSQVQERNMIVPTDDESCDNVKLFGFPPKFSEYEDPKSRPMAPRLDQHREEILNSVGNKLLRSKL